jgi:hypothetical protein
MCLYLTEKSGIKVAKEDIICYKVMEKWGEILTSPYQNMRYKCGTMRVSETPITVKHIFAIGPCVEEGFHSVSNEQEAERLKSGLQTYATLLNLINYKYVVVKCLIPAGTSYAVGVFNDFGEHFNSICSERIIVLEEV